MEIPEPVAGPSGVNVDEAITKAPPKKSKRVASKEAAEDEPMKKVPAIEAKKAKGGAPKEKPGKKAAATKISKVKADENDDIDDSTEEVIAQPAKAKKSAAKNKVKGSIFQRL